MATAIGVTSEPIVIFTDTSIAFNTWRQGSTDVLAQDNVYSYSPGRMHKGNVPTALPAQSARPSGSSTAVTAGA